MHQSVELGRRALDLVQALVVLLIHQLKRLEQVAPDHLGITPPRAVDAAAAARVGGWLPTSSAPWQQERRDPPFPNRRVRKLRPDVRSLFPCSIGAGNTPRSLPTATSSPATTLPWRTPAKPKSAAMAAAGTQRTCVRAVEFCRVRGEEERRGTCVGNRASRGARRA